jgi:hypothetical protein
MSHLYAPKPKEDAKSRSSTTSTNRSAKTVSLSTNGPSEKPQALPSTAAGQKTEEGRRQLDQLWDRMRHHYRVEKISTALSKLGLGAILGGFVTFIGSLPHTPAGQACINVAQRHPTPFRVGLAAVAVALMAAGALLVTWGAKRWFM